MLTTFLNLEDDASVADICEAIHILLKSEEETRQENGNPTLLPEDDPNKEWEYIFS